MQSSKWSPSSILAQIMFLLVASYNIPLWIGHGKGVKASEVRKFCGTLTNGGDLFFSAAISKTQKKKKKTLKGNCYL